MLIYLHTQFSMRWYMLLLRLGRGAVYCNQPICLCICMFVCLSACPQAYLWNCGTNLYKSLSADPRWPWLGPPLAALHYVMYFWFYRWHHIWP